ncbi:MAG TPA: ABC transporter substrate-binding protein [Gemmatimonadaceae bacterium]|nr:ABC transporter substrate-binding protein [Gemmatimonadaceae bacterium]
MRHALALPALLVAAIACAERGSSNAPSGGTLIVTIGADADHLLPPLITGLVGRQVADLMYYRLAELTPPIRTAGDEGFEPRLASRWRWAADSLSIAFDLDPRAQWHDGTPVRAKDVVFTYSLYTDPVVGAPGSVNFANVDSITAPDSMTVAVWFQRRKAEQFFEVVHNLVPVPAHVFGPVQRDQLRASGAVREPIGNGPYRLVRWERASRIELAADTAHWRGRPRLDRVIWTPAPDPVTTVTRLFAGEADFYESLRPENLAQAESDSALRVVPYPSLQYGFLQFNLRDPGDSSRPHRLLADRELRRAISMAVDRDRLVRSIYDTLAFVAIGPVSRAVAMDTTMTHLPHDPERARRTLDSLGWRVSGGDGIRQRDGVPLAFGVIVPTSSRPRINAAVILQEQLRQVGVRLDIEQMEFTTFLERQRARRFESYLGVWVTTPTPSGVRQPWSTAGQSNFGAYASPVFDALVDSAVYARSPVAARTYWRRAYQTIIDDAPAIWLYEPRMVAAHHRRLRITEFRADAWWAGIPEWSIPPDERIARDRIPLAVRHE